jgi:prepilin-type N-terminal cleavage/methylation domain-containing protein
VRVPSRERGFTLIEIMVAVAIIAVLAIIAIPQFTREARKSRGKTEVNAMFAELSTKLEIYKNEFGSFLAAAQCPSTGPNKAGYNFATTCITTGSTWETLRIQPTESKLRCAYTISVGAKGVTLTPPTGFKNSQGAQAAEPSLASSWWYVLAECDENASGGTNAKYYQSSVDPTIQITNSGS